MTQAPSLTATLMAARPAQGLSFADPGAAMGRDELLIALLFHSQSTASEPEAPQRIGWLGLDPSMGSALQADPTKGCLDPVIPSDPSIYCFYKMIQEYEIALKGVIHESCDDGIMSALDFSLNDDKAPDPVRVRAK